jgi:hypothetical protein
MVDINYSLWKWGAAIGRQDRKGQSTAKETPPHRRLKQG